MKPVIIFAGTIEGRTLSEFLSGKRIAVTACVATDYGETLLTENEYLHVHAGRMDEWAMAAFLREKEAELVVDATHPYAVEVSRNVAAACREAGAEYIRLIRDQDAWDAEGAVITASVDEAVEYLKDKEGNILATTGSKELHKYTAIPDYEKRVFARVLSTGQVAAACEKLGFVGKNLICMQGPFSEELNTALLRQFDCKYLVTKETGKAGGFGEKVRAARKAGAQLVLVGRPQEQEGYSIKEVLRLLEERLGVAGFCDDSLTPIPSASEPTARTVTLIGIGMGTPEGMTVEAARAIHEAELLIGAKRMLEAADEPAKPCYTAYNADEIAEYIAQHPEYSRIAILLSGDIGFYSGAKKLYDALEGNGCEVRSLCGISSVVYFCGKLHVAWEDVCLLSTHGREANLVAAVKSHARTFTLLSAKGSVRKLCTELSEYGLGDVKVFIGERLGYADERISSGTPAQL
ncbi:MAG: precorrin-6A reductase, partial [Lachnospiraceae bacterium]|nr:precorrin-6A reductase [Lachnospiraceae bacterium]